eukprot:7383346-Karenia_brevis.AAC.1
MEQFGEGPKELSKGLELPTLSGGMEVGSHPLMGSPRAKQVLQCMKAKGCVAWKRALGNLQVGRTWDNIIANLVRGSTWTLRVVEGSSTCT